MDDFGKIAKVVDKELPQRLRGSLSVRPLKLAFVIHESIPLDKFQKIVEYQSTLWGGRNNLFVPTDGKKIQRDWLRNLKNHNADTLILCQTDGIEYSGSLINQLTKDYDALRINIWLIDRGDFTQQHFDGIQDENGLTSVVLLSHFTRKEKPVSIETSNAAVLVGDSTSPYHLYLALNHGSLSDKYLTSFVDIFKANQIEINQLTTLLEYIHIAKELQAKFTPLSLSGFGTKTSENLYPYDRPKGVNLFVIGNRQILDLCLAWNFKLTPSLFKRSSDSVELVLPKADLMDDEKFEKLAYEINSGSLQSFNQLHLHNLSLSSKSIEGLKQRFSKAIKAMSIHIQRELPPVAVTRVSNKETAIDILTEDGHFMARNERPEFDSSVFKGNWVNEFQFKDSLNRSISFPDSSKLNSLLSINLPQSLLDHFGFLGRQTNNGLAFRVNSGSSFVSGRLPDAFETISAFFEDRSLTTKLNANHSYITGLQQMFSEIGGQKNFADQSIREMLWTTARCTTSLSLSDLKALLKRNDETLLDNLIKVGILLRGVELVCENCGLRHWYSVDLLYEVVNCIGCRRKVRLPLGSNFTFRLNQLAVSALLVGGGMTLLLLEYLLSKHSLSKPVSAFGIDVFKANSSNNFAEIDLFAYLNGEVVLAECKDFRNGFSKKQYKEAMQQVKKLVRVAKVMEAEAVIFASFSEMNPNETSELFRKLSTKFGLPVNCINLQSEEILDLKANKYVKLTEQPYFTYFGDTPRRR